MFGAARPRYGVTYLEKFGTSLSHRQFRLFPIAIHSQPTCTVVPQAALCPPHISWQDTQFTTGLYFVLFASLFQVCFSPGKSRHWNIASTSLPNREPDLHCLFSHSHRWPPSTSICRYARLPLSACQITRVQPSRASPPQTTPITPHSPQSTMKFNLGRKERLIATITISFAFFIAEIASTLFLVT